MNYPILLPADPEETPERVVPGSVLLRVGHGKALVWHERHGGFADLCQQAARGHGRAIPLDFPVREVGYYDDHNGEVRISPRYMPLMEGWCGHRFYRNDLEARDNRAARRQQARRLTMQGRYHEAYRLDHRLGL